MNYTLLNSKDLFTLCFAKYQYNKKESYSIYHKFQVSQGNSIVVFLSGYSEKWKWFYQSNPTQKFSIADGVLESLWSEQEVLNLRSIVKVGNIPTQKESRSIERKESLDLLSFVQELQTISTYNYRKQDSRKDFWVSFKTMFKNNKGALVLPQYRVESRKIKTVGFIIKHPNGFKRYIGGRGIVIHKKGKPTITILGENILDCIAYSRLNGIENNYLAIATHGNISADMISSIRNLLVLYRIDKNRKLNLVFDNDIAGKEFTKQILDSLGGTSHTPTKKDFFEDYQHSLKE